MLPQALFYVIRREQREAVQYFRCRNDLKIRSQAEMVQTSALFHKHQPICFVEQKRARRDL